MCVTAAATTTPHRVPYRVLNVDAKERENESPESRDVERKKRGEEKARKPKRGEEMYRKNIKNGVQ